MQRYVAERIFAVESAENDLYGGTKRVPIYLASDADAAISEAVRREREEIANNLQTMINSVPAMGFDQKIGVKKAMVYIRARGESKPEPRLGTNPPEANPAKIGRIAVPRRTDWEIPTVELADKLNELIDAVNGGKV
jgi:hypothetical protein